MDALRITVPGQPIPQPRARVSTFGGRGRAYTPAGHKIHAYRQAIALLAKASGRRFDGPILLDVVAVFERPPSHWLKRGLKASAPGWPRGDGDNLLKGVADALKVAGVYHDDDRLVDWHIFKVYGKSARTEITVRPFEGYSDADA